MSRVLRSRWLSNRKNRRPRGLSGGCLWAGHRLNTTPRLNAKSRLPAGRWFDSEESRFVRICGASRGFTRAYRGLLLPPFLEQDVEADLGPRSIASVGQRDEPGQLAIGLTFRAGERDASLASSTGHRIARKGQAKFPRAGFRFPQAAPHPTEGRTNRWDFLVTPSRRVSR